MRSRWNELVQERCELIQRGKELLAKSSLSEADQDEDDALQARLDEVERSLKILNGEREAEGAITPVQSVNPNADPDASPKVSPFQAAGGRGRKYADVFGPTVANMGGFRDREEFLGLIHTGQHDPRLQAIATEGTPSDGGFMVPTELVAEMLDAALEDEVVRPRAHVVPMASATKKVWGWDVSDSSSTLLGAFSGQWVPETGAITVETPQLRLIELASKKLALLTQTSNELLADSSYGRELETAMVKAISWFLDLSFLQGDGAGEPLGALNAPSLISVAKETGQAAATILYENLVKMLARLHPACVNSAIWVANAGTRAELLTLGYNVGVGGSHVPVLTESAGTFRMLTLPVIFTEKVPALGSKGDVLLADFSQYYVGLRQGMSIARSAHLGFATDTSHYRGLLRADGQPKWAGPYTPKNGATLSWCVTLDERA